MGKLPINLRWEYPGNHEIGCPMSYPNLLVTVVSAQTCLCSLPDRILYNEIISAAVEDRPRRYPWWAIKNKKSRGR